MNSKRIKWVDNLKGFILLLVCIGHVHFKTSPMAEVTSMTAAFRMTTFFFLSGYLFSTRKHTNISSYVKSKTKTLLLPYFCMSLVFSFFDIRLYNVSTIQYHHCADFLILHHLVVPSPIQNSIQYIYFEIVNIFVSGTSTPISTPLWFVSVLFWASICFYIIHHITPKKNKNIYILGYSFVCLSVGWICNIFHYFLPLNFHVVCSASFYFSMGYFAKSLINNHLNTMPTRYLVLLLVIISPIYLYGINVNGQITFYLNSLGGNLFGLLVSTLSGIAGIVITFILLSRIPGTSVIGGLFRNLARNALIFLAMHYWVIVTCDIIFHKYNQLPLYKYTNLLAALIITIASFSLFRNKLYKLLGKEKISIKESYSLE